MSSDPSSLESPPPTVGPGHLEGGDPTLGDAGLTGPTGPWATAAGSDPSRTTEGDQGRPTFDGAEIGGDGDGRSTAAGTTPPRSTGRSPRFLGEYQLLEEIARGGMGVVYRARQDKLNRLVALKLIRAGPLADPDELRRFRREAEAIAELDHPHIIPIYEIGQEDDQPYFSMKLVEGGNLARHIPRLKDEPAACAALVAKVARAVHYAHQRTILHRDIKPSNILLDHHDEPYVTDFGLAKRIGIDVGTMATMTGAVMGTPAYMPPEQARGGAKSVTTAADVYSLGATLYECLTGRPPFSGESAGEIMRQVLDQEPPPPRSSNSRLDRDLETICLKCLHKEPGRRYGSAEALAEDLERWAAGLPITARPVSARERVFKWVKRRKALAALVLTLPVALVSLFGGGAWFTLQLWRERDLANRGRYAADMSLARRALDDGLIYQVREQLATYRTGPRALGDLRSFEWYYLAALCDPATVRLRGHARQVTCVAFHPDGNRILSGDTDGSVRVWDLAGRRAIHAFERRGGIIRCVAISPDGRTMAAGDEAGRVRLWDLETGRERALEGHRAGLRSVCFSPDNRRLLSTDIGGLIVQWDIAAAGQEFDLRHDPDRDDEVIRARPENISAFHYGRMALYTPDGRSIISSGADEKVIIWDIASRSARDVIRAGALIMGLAISPDGRHLAMAEQSATLEILDLNRPHDPPRIIPGASHRVSAVAFSPDGKTLAVADWRSGLRLLDARDGQILDRFRDSVNMAPLTLAFGGGGRVLAMAAGDEVHVVRLERWRDGVPVRAPKGPIRRLAISPDGRLLAVGGEAPMIEVRDTRSGRTTRTIRGAEPAVLGLAFVPRPGAPWLVSVGGHNGLIEVWDPLREGPPLRAWSGHRGAIYAAAARPDGGRVATGGEDGVVQSWDPATGRPDPSPMNHGATISALAYDREGAVLASGGMDRTVQLWSPSSGARRRGTLEHPHPISCLAFSPDGRLLAAGGGSVDKGGTVVIWDAASGAVVATIECPRGVDSLSFSPDGRRVATCGPDPVVQVWDTTGGHETLSLEGHRDRVSNVVFAPRTMRLYTSGRDGAVKLWDGETARDR